MISNIIKDFSKNNEVSLETYVANFGRMKQVSIIGGLVSVAHMIYFLFFVVPEGNDLFTWRIGIILSHSVLSVLFVFTYLMTVHFSKNNKATLFSMRLTQYANLFTIVTTGVGIVTLDQLVTTNITPYFVICLIVALVFLLRPITSLVIYIYTYAIFFFSIAITQYDPVVLASNRLNGLTITAIGVTLSIILWNYYSKDYYQRKLIEQQYTELASQKIELEEINKKLTHMVAYDSLTGLFNRREFEKIVNKTLLEMKRYKSNACLIIVDIDHFKNINDQYGHPVGDELLKAFSYVLKDELRDIDVIARWGGEEFIIMLHNTPAHEGVPVAERIRSTIEANKFIIDQHEINVTASFGISQLLYEEPDWLYTAYQKADKALYMAKNNGRNQCIILDAEPLTT